MTLIAIAKKLPFYNPLFSGYSRLISKLFHGLYYNRGKQTWQNTKWFGTPLLKCPLDLWIYQEIIYNVQPDLIIECGTHKGGSAKFLADLLDLNGKGRIVSIDIGALSPPAHPRVTYLKGSSTDLGIIKTIKAMLLPEEKVLVILDSYHGRDHVLEEMKLYSHLVTKGSYLIVEDSNVNGHPVFPAHGPGPMEAIVDFMKDENKGRFKVDANQEKFFLTFNPQGYLKRVN